LIRFGSRTDVVVPPGSEILVRKGDRMRGGESEIARFPSASGGAQHG
jgi:phosphatidylserine decarboxylase